MQPLRRFLSALALCASALALLSCASTPLSAIERFESDEGDIELLLEPIDVWDDKGALEPEEIAVNEKTLYFRLRHKELFERAWVRLGLFWHSKLDYIILPVVVTGPTVEINKVRISADEDTEDLQPARNFEFEPGERSFDKGLSSGVFTLSPSILSKVAGAKNVYVDILTSRGNLRVNLSAVTGRSDGELTGSAKYQFTEFYQRQQAAN